MVLSGGQTIRVATTLGPHSELFFEEDGYTVENIESTDLRSVDDAGNNRGGIPDAASNYTRAMLLLEKAYWLWPE